MIATAPFDASNGDDWDVAVDQYPEEDANRVFYGPGDTRDGFNNDVRTCIEMLISELRAGHPTVLWVHLWDEDLLREYKGFITGLFSVSGIDVAHGRAAVRFYRYNRY